MVLVVYVLLQLADACPSYFCRAGDVEALSKRNQWIVGIQDKTFHEKYGYLEICPQVLRAALVEIGLAASVPYCLGTDSACSWQ